MARCNVEFGGRGEGGEEENIEHPAARSCLLAIRSVYGMELRQRDHVDRRIPPRFFISSVESAAARESGLVDSCFFRTDVSSDRRRATWTKSLAAIVIYDTTPAPIRARPSAPVYAPLQLPRFQIELQSRQRWPLTRDNRAIAARG